MKYLNKHLQILICDDMDEVEKIKEQNVGNWIAIKDKKVVATSRTFREVMRRVRERKIKDITVVYSPTEEEKKYGYLFLVFY